MALATSASFVPLSRLGGGPLPSSTRPVPRARRRRVCTFCRIVVGGGTFSVSPWRSSTLPLPFPLPLCLTLLDLLSGRALVFGSLALPCFEASLSRLDASLMCWNVVGSSVGGVSDEETALASFRSSTSETMPTAADESVMAAWSTVFVIGWKGRVQS